MAKRIARREASSRAPRTQAERSSSTKARLIEAAIECLIDHGYAYTTTVEVCARAELTRGAYNHHYPGTNELFADVLEQLYARLAESRLSSGRQADSLEELIREGWQRVQRPEFKAVIELWLASRNDPALGESLAPAIARLAQLFAPEANEKLAGLLASDPELVSLYRLAFEATIGLGLGRATSPKGAPVSHESQVLDLLLSLAREREREALAKAG